MSSEISEHEFAKPRSTYAHATISHGLVGAQGAPFGYVDPFEQREDVVYRGIDNKIHMLSRDKSELWSSQCIRDLARCEHFASSDPMLQAAGITRSRDRVRS